MRTDKDLCQTIIININSIEARDRMPKKVSPDLLAIGIQDIQVFILRTNQNLVFSIAINVRNVKPEKTIRKVTYAPKTWLTIKSEQPQGFAIYPEQNLYLAIFVQIYCINTMNPTLYINW